MALLSPISIYAAIFYSLQIIFGIPGNVLIITVYYKKKRKISTDILIIAQGIIDLAASLLAPINIINSVSDQFTVKVVCRIALFGINSLAFASLFLTAAIAIDRFFYVCRPFGKRTSNKRALVLGVTCWVLGSSLTCTKLIYVDAVTSSRGEITCLVVDVYDFLDTLEAWLKTSGFVFALVTSVVLYGKIYMAIRNQAKVHAQLTGGISHTLYPANLSQPQSGSSGLQSSPSEPLDKTITSDVDLQIRNPSNHLLMNSSSPKDLSGTLSVSGTVDQRSHTHPKPNASGPSCPRPKLSDRGENRTTKMLMAVTTILLASWLPPIVFFHLRDSTLEIIESSITADTLVYIGKRLPGINHIINYFVYTLMNKRFRMDCKRLFRS